MVNINTNFLYNQINKKSFLTKKNVNERIAPYIFISPYFIIYFMFSIFPIIYTFYISLTEWNGFTTPIFIGLKNYFTLVKDTRFYEALLNTLLFMIMIIPLQLILGMLIAVILSSKVMVAKNTYRLLNFLPYLTTPVALGIIFGIMFDPQFGAINIILGSLHIVNNPIDWMGEPWPARIMVSLITVWRYYGYTAVLFMAGITNIDPALYEAADIEGASSVQKFFKITFPLLKPVTVFVILTTMIGCFQIFEEPFMLFSAGAGVGGQLVGGPDNSCLTGVWLLYDTAFGTVMRFGYGSAIAYGLFIFIAVLTLVTNKFINRGEAI